MKKLFFLVSLLFCLVWIGCFSDKGAPRSRASHTPAPRPLSWARINKVVVVVLENTDFEDAVHQPFLNRLSREGALLKSYYGITHPSQPNYIAMISGGVHGVDSNADSFLATPHLGDLLERGGKTWKSYAEGFPGNCYLGSHRGDYVRKHVPFLSFKNVQQNPSRCSRIVNADQFRDDLQVGTLANYSLYVPDQKNDGHNTGVAFADQWLSTFFEPIFENRNALQDTLFVVTFDEGSTRRDNRVMTIFYGSGVRAGAETSQDYDHYSLLRTVEEIFSLPTLNKYDITAPIIDDIWTD